VAKPRIALCLEYPIDRPGGTETLVRELIRGLAERYALVLVSADRSDGLSPWRGLISDHLSWSDDRSYQEQAPGLAAGLRDLKVELVHFHLGGLYAWNTRARQACPIHHCLRLGLPVLLTNHGAFSVLDYCGNQRPLWFKVGCLPVPWINRLLLIRSSEGEVTVSKNDCELMKRSFFPAARKIRQLYHACPRTEMPDPSLQREKFILNIGSIGPRKGQPDLVNAFGEIASRFPDWTLILAGMWSDALTVSQIEKAILQNGIGSKVRMAGVVSEPEKINLMKRAGLFVMPSHWEGLGLALQESLYFGCPAIGYRVGGIPELIDHESNGLLVPPGDRSGLREALARLMGDAPLRERFGRKARESIVNKGMTARRMIAGYDEMYRNILAD
jgi:glycosyltransferase involved in cell wall biosynthesis